jgi:hypothetical protein
MLISFVTRKFFIATLGLEVSGIDGAFTNAVSMLAVVELGLGLGMSYKLYDPIAHGNNQKIACILVFFKKIYTVISALILILGFIFSSFITGMVKENFSKSWLCGIFFLYITDVIVSYLFFHRRIMFIADQRSFAINLVRLLAIVILFFLQMSALYFLKSFELYLISKIVSRLIENLIIYFLFKKQYGIIDFKNADKFNTKEVKEMWRETGAMFFHRIGAVGARQISGLMVLAVSSLHENGIFFNYMLIVYAILGISNEFFCGIGASFGNFLNTESDEKIYENFDTIYFLNFFMYSAFVSAFFGTVTPFVVCWTGKGTVFPLETVMAISTLLYISGIKQSADMAKSASGIFVQDCFVPVAESALNVLFSFILGQKFGLSGVMIGGCLSILCAPFISQPYLLYKFVFKKPRILYYKKYLTYFILSFIYSSVSFLLIKNFTFGFGFMQVLINFSICLTIPLICNTILFYETRQFRQVLGFIKKLMKKAFVFNRDNTVDRR